MDIEPLLKSDPQFPESSKPRVGVLDNPAMFAKPLAAFDAEPCNPAHDAFAGPVRVVV